MMFVPLRGPIGIGLGCALLAGAVAQSRWGIAIGIGVFAVVFALGAWLATVAAPSGRQSGEDGNALLGRWPRPASSRVDPTELTNPQDSVPWPDEDPSQEDKLTREGLGR
jgi:hypothetical protein